MPASILHGAQQNTTKCHNKETFSSFLSREHFKNLLEFFRFARCKLSVIRQSVLLFLCATVRPKDAECRRGGLVTQCTISAFLVSIMIKDHISIVLSS